MTDLPLIDDYHTRLLASIGKLLAHQSLLEITIADIVREARVSKRTFYEQFANKEECFLALFRLNGAQLLEAVREAVAFDAPLAVRVERGCKTYLATMATQARLMQRLYIDILSLGAQGMHVRHDLNRQFVDLLISVIEADRASFPGLQINDQMLMCLMVGLNELALYRIENNEIDTLVDLCPSMQSLLTGALMQMMQPAPAASGATATA